MANKKNKPFRTFNTEKEFNNFCNYLIKKGYKRGYSKACKEAQRWIDKNIINSDVLFDDEFELALPKNA